LSWASGRTDSPICASCSTDEEPRRSSWQRSSCLLCLGRHAHRQELGFQLQSFFPVDHDPIWATEGGGRRKSRRGPPLETEHPAVSTPPVLLGCGCLLATGTRDKRTISKNQTTVDGWRGSHPRARRSPLGRQPVLGGPSHLGWGEGIVAKALTHGCGGAQSRWLVNGSGMPTRAGDSRSPARQGALDQTCCLLLRRRRTLGGVARTEIAVLLSPSRSQSSSRRGTENWTVLLGRPSPPRPLNDPCC